MFVSLIFYNSLIFYFFAYVTHFTVFEKSILGNCKTKNQLLNFTPISDLPYFSLYLCCCCYRVLRGFEEDSVVSNKDGYYNINTTDPTQGRKSNNTKINDPKNDILNSKLDSHFLREVVQLSDSPKIDIPEGSNRENSVERHAGDRGPVVVPIGAVLKKGFQRVAVLSVTPDGLMTSSSGDRGSGSWDHTTAHPRSTPVPCVTVYEVVIHGGEAFLKAKNIQVDSNDPQGTSIPNVLDYSTGWQHSLLLLR
jgi:hypothetical protein